MSALDHLSEDQLSALLDDALAPAARAAAEAHLATCDVCRAKLAELATLERELGGALTHDPGESYFATFAERVAARIAAGERGSAPVGTPAPPRRSPWAWLLSPRGLSFAGGMAALLLTAGIAWLRFQHADAGSALHAAAPSAQRSRLDERALAPPAAEESPAAPVPAPAQRTLATDAPLVQPQRAAEAKRATTPLDAQAEHESAGAPAADALGKDTRTPAASAPAASALAPPAEMRAEKRTQENTVNRLVAPPPPTAEPQGLTQSFAKQSKARSEPPPSAAATEQAMKLQLADAAPLASPCGKVTDTRGTPIAGVQLTLLGESERSAHSDADGTFCLPRAIAGDTLVLMRVGYASQRVVLSAATSLAFGLEPVGTLGAHGGLALGGKPSGMLDLPGAAPAPDVYAGLADTVRNAVTAARTRTAFARHDRGAAAWESAAARWDGVAAMTRGAAAEDARFQALGALREAWHASPNAARAERLRTALAAFIAATSPTLPERATALRWQAELENPKAH